MKRLTTLLLALVLMISLSATAFADVIYEPMDEFLLDHYDQCDAVRRNYRALTEVTVYQSPEDSMAIAGTLAEGTSIHIYYSYTDSQNNLWGCCENYEDNWAGWVPMAYMELVYDYISFEEDYGQAFVDQSGQLPAEYAQSKVWFWKYPGSESGFEFDMGSWGSEYLPEYHQVYEDDHGHTWGYVGYYMANRNFWICLDDPSGNYDTLFPGGAPEVDIIQPGETEATLPAQEIVPQMSSGGLALRIGVGAAVVICVAFTVILLVRMKKKSK